MHNTLTFPPLDSSEIEAHHTFNVVVAYEDFETGKHAKKTYDFLTENLGEDCQFSNQMWKFDVLAVPKLREMAARDAAEADIVIVSSHGKGDLPADVKEWVELWLREKTRAIALVGLFDREEYVDNPARSFLAGAAQRIGMEFFSQPGQWPKQSNMPTALEWEHQNQTLSALIGKTQHEGNFSHWGINE